MILLASHSIECLQVILELLFGVVDELCRYLFLVPQYFKVVRYLVFFNIDPIKS